MTKQPAPRFTPLRLLMIGGAILILFILVLPRGSNAPELELSRIFQLAEAGQITKIQVSGDKLNVTDINGDTFTSRKEESVRIFELLQQRGISTDAAGIQKDVDITVMAKQTHGFSGADLANLVNEAAILAVRQGKEAIGLLDLEEAVDRVIAGPARKSRQVSQREREIVAYHEARHALLASQIPDANPVHKVTIVGRGAAGGYTRMLPEEDRNLWSKPQFEAMLAVMMGGQAAEELVFGDITTGASSDLQTANSVARKMVTEYGMSGGLGPRTFGSGQGTVFLGKELAQSPDYSDAVAEKIDTEIGSLLKTAQVKAKQVIEANRAKLTLLAKKLWVEETIEGAELQHLLAGSAQNAPLATK